MRHGTSGRRQRNRGNGGRRGNNARMQVYDSNGPDVRIRGTAHQVAEKYEALAKDAASSGDIILSQSYLQHAEHYLRIITSLNEDARDAPQKDRQNQKSRKKQQGNQRVQEEDLSLPASILGESAEVSKPETDEERTSEFSDA